MAIVNVKVGSVEVPMDLEFQHNARNNIQYILKVLGVQGPDLLPQASGAVPPGTSLKFDMKEAGGASFPGGTTLKDNAIQEHIIPQAGEENVMDNPGDPKTVAGVKTVEVFDPNDPTFEPPFPEDRFGTGSDLPVRNI